MEIDKKQKELFDTKLNELMQDEEFKSFYDEYYSNYKALKKRESRRNLIGLIILLSILYVPLIIFAIEINIKTMNNPAIDFAYIFVYAVVILISPILLSKIKIGTIYDNVPGLTEHEIIMHRLLDIFSVNDAYIVHNSMVSLEKDLLKLFEYGYFTYEKIPIYSENVDDKCSYMLINDKYYKMCFTSLNEAKSFFIKDGNNNKLMLEHHPPYHNNVFERIVINPYSNRIIIDYNEFSDELKKKYEYDESYYGHTGIFEM